MEREDLLTNKDIPINIIINHLKKGDIEEAKLECFTSGDKFDSFEDIKEVLRTELFDEEEERPWMTSEEWKNKLKESDD